MVSTARVTIDVQTPRMINQADEGYGMASKATFRSRLIRVTLFQIGFFAK